jgi:hypothetical protein
MDNEYPDEVEAFHSELRMLPGVVAVDTGVEELSQFPLDSFSLPGVMGDLPHSLLRRTGGGLPDEAWAHTEIVFDRSTEAWLSLEFLAWWVRDQSRGGDEIQLRPVALPPRVHETQLGQTLKFVIDHFAIVQRICHRCWSSSRSARSQ